MRRAEMSPYYVNLARRGRSAALLGAAFALVVTPLAATAAECPDPPTVSAAQLLEFKTMMMVVGLRCKSVGIMMAEHNEEMAAVRSTMFEEADRRVRRYIAENNRPAPVQVAPPAPVAAATAAVPKARLAAAGGPARGRGKAATKGRAGAAGKGSANAPGNALAKAPAGTAAKASATALPAATAGTAAKASGKAFAKAPAGTAAKASATALAVAPAVPNAKVAPLRSKAAAPLSKPASRSRRDDPYEKYLTRVGTSYGMGDNSLGTCSKYDALVSYLADRTTPNRALSMAADRMIGKPVLEKQATCLVNP